MKIPEPNLTPLLAAANIVNPSWSQSITRRRGRVAAISSAHVAWFGKGTDPVHVIVPGLVTTFNLVPLFIHRLN